MNNFLSDLPAENDQLAQPAIENGAKFSKSAPLFARGN